MPNDWHLLIEMTEALAYANQVGNGRAKEQVRKLTEAVLFEAGIPASYAQYLPADYVSKLTKTAVPLTEVDNRLVQALATRQSERKLREYLATASCKHVLEGQPPCRACIKQQTPVIAAEALRNATTTVKSYGRLVASQGECRACRRSCYPSP